jgi:hypothetical protein
MSDRNDYRAVSTFDLRPVFTSLGLPVAAFRDPARTPESTFFDAVLNADPTRPDGLWLFKGSDYYLYNLHTGKIDDGPRPIAGNLGGDTLPILFQSGIDSAVWAGPAFPHLWYVFKDEMYVRLSSNVMGGGGGPGFVLEQLWPVDEGPRGVLGAWASGAWTAPDGTWLTPGVPVALHGLGSQWHGMIHLFKDGEYIRHNLNNGRSDAGPMPIKEAWNLPDDFADRIDVAFYGRGRDEENIYFFSGLHYALYDFRRNEVLGRGLVEDKFPAFAQFLGRPQIFLVEDYTLETYVGPPQLGRLVDTKTIGAGASIKRILVTETVASSSSSLTKSLLESQDSNVVKNFYEQMDKQTSASAGSESYRYQLNANFHGDASANSLWGGEVNAALNVQGGTDTLRSGVAEAAFGSIRSQVDASKREINQRTYESTEQIQHMERVVRQETFEEVNRTDRVRRYEFYEQLQPYLTFLILKNVRLAYADGSDPPKIVGLRDMPRLLADVLVADDQQTQIAGYIEGELSAVSDYEGRSRSLIADGSASPGLTLNRDQTTSYAIQKPDGTVQNLSVRGVINATKSWLTPTYTITCEQV